MPLPPFRAWSGAIVALALVLVLPAKVHAQALPHDAGSAADGPTRSTEGSDKPLRSLETSDAALQTALADVLQALAQQRQRSKLALIDCTKDFSAVFRYPTAAPYVAFFRSIGFEAITARVNQKNFVYWEFYARQLAALGFEGFIAGDRIVISLAVGTTPAQAVMTFKATLLNSNQL